MADMKECNSNRCNNLFTPKPNQLYCCKKCKKDANYSPENIAKWRAANGKPSRKMLVNQVESQALHIERLKIALERIANDWDNNEESINIAKAALKETEGK